MDPSNIYTCSCSCRACETTITYLLQKMTEMELLCADRIKTTREQFETMLSTTENVFKNTLDESRIHHFTAEEKCSNKYSDDIKNLENDIRVLKEKNDSIFNTYKNTSLKFDAVTYELWTSKKELEQFKKDSAQHTNTISSLETKISLLEDSLKLKDKTISGLEKQVISDVGAHRRLESNRQIQKLHDTIKEKDNQITLLKQECNTMQRRINNNDVEHKEIVQKLEDIVQMLRAEKVKMSTDKDALQYEHTKIQSELESCRKELDIWKRNMRVLSHKLKIDNKNSNIK